jgi:hypothetical protein
MPRRNPFMSMWLSAANRVAGTGRGLLTVAVRRQQAAATAALWKAATGGTVATPRKRRRGKS